MNEAPKYDLNAVMDEIERDQAVKSGLINCETVHPMILELLEEMTVEDIEGVSEVVDQSFNCLAVEALSSLNDTFEAFHTVDGGVVVEIEADSLKSLIVAAMKLGHAIITKVDERWKQHEAK